MIQIELQGLSYRQVPIFALMAFYEKDKWIEIDNMYARYFNGVATLLSENEYNEMVLKQVDLKNRGCAHDR